MKKINFKKITKNIKGRINELKVKKKKKNTTPVEKAENKRNITGRAADRAKSADN